MGDNDMKKEQRILTVMRKVLGQVIRDTTTPPGMRHPLSEGCIQDIRECLALIAARETELAEALGEPRHDRPHFADEPRRASVVPLTTLTGGMGAKGGKKSDEP